MKVRSFVAASLLLVVFRFTSAADFDPEVNIKKAEQAVQDARNMLNTKNDVEQAQNELRKALQLLGTQRSFIGDAQGAMSAFDEMKLLQGSVNTPSTDDIQRLSESVEEDAIEAIVREAGKHQIVILNEAHHVPMHRTFAMRLARELHRIGYTWLACETFEKTPFGKGYLSLADGYYSREPSFGNFLRDAAVDGWQLVQYEPLNTPSNGTLDEQIERREIGEAKNLVERIFSKHPAAKVFIYVGYSHARKMPQVSSGNGPVWMAAQLRHLTGLDPLTIDQVSMMEHTAPEAEHPLYTPAVNREPRTMPFVLRSKNGSYEVFGTYRFAVDMQVVHPRYGMDVNTDRPKWMRTLANFKETDVPEKMRDTATNHFVYAYLKGQPEDSVPVDVIQIVQGRPIPKFMLPSGEFRFTVRP